MLIKNVCIKRVNDFKLFLSLFDTLLDFLFLALAHSPTLPLSNNNCLCLESQYIRKLLTIPIVVEFIDREAAGERESQQERERASRRENE